MSPEFFLRGLEGYTKAEVTITLPDGESWSGVMDAPYPHGHEFWGRPSSLVRPTVRKWADKLGAPARFTAHMKSKEAP